MSLEQALIENTAMMKENNALLTQLLAKSGAPAPATAAPAASAPEEPKAEAAEKKPAAKKAEKKDDGADAKKSTLALYTGWLTEFAADHPETVARQAALRTLLDKLGEEKISTITDSAKFEQLSAWLNDPAKGQKDRGFGAGRFAADPSSDDAEDGGIDL